MDPATVGLLGLITNWVGKSATAGKGLWGLRKPRVTLELEGIRFTGDIRIPASQGIPPAGIFYELLELTLINNSNRNVLIDEVNISFYRSHMSGEEALTYAAPIAREIELNPDESKRIKVEPWYWLSEMIAHMRIVEFRNEPERFKAFERSLGDLRIGFGVSVSTKRAFVRNRTERLSFDAKKFGFLREGESSCLDLGSLILRDYRALKQGMLKDYHKLEHLDHGSEDRESHRFTLAVLEALELDPDVEGIIQNNDFLLDLDDPFSVEFRDPPVEEIAPLVTMMANGGSWAKIRLLKTHLAKHTKSDLWIFDSSADYFLLNLLGYLERTADLALDSIHPDFLLSSKSILERFGIFEGLGVRANIPPIEMLEEIKRLPPSHVKIYYIGANDPADVDSFGIPLRFKQKPKVD